MQIRGTWLLNEAAVAWCGGPGSEVLEVKCSAVAALEFF